MSIKPGHDLYVQVRSLFVGQNTSLGAWCRKEGIARQHARLVLTGAWTGPKARALLARILRGAGLKAAA